MDKYLQNLIDQGADPVLVAKLSTAAPGEVRGPRTADPAPAPSPPTDDAPKPKKRPVRKPR